MAIDPLTGQTVPDAPAGFAPQVPEMTMEAGTPGEETVDRNPPEVDEKRKALVTKLTDRVINAKKYWEPCFKRMREDMEFSYGKQWSSDKEDKRYVANVTLRVVAQKTAFLYAKNPKAVARRREKILNTAWDGTQQQLQQMQQSAAVAAQTGMLAAPGMQEAIQQSMAIMQDYQQVRATDKLYDDIAKTLELLYDYNVKEQVHPFKQMMKMTVRRTVTCGVGYVKIGFQRAMARRPEVEARIADVSEKLATMERLSADLADNQVQTTDAEAEQLKLMLADLAQQVEYVVREGLVFDYPGCTAIIPDPKTIHLREFLGGDWVCQ